MILEDKIESVFGSCFSTHGLGGVLTCGVTGIKAGLSHSPVCPEVRHRVQGIATAQGAQGAQGALRCGTGSRG